MADIEENIWASRLGLKGKVDVTVKTLAGSTYKVKTCFSQLRKWREGGRVSRVEILLL